MILDFPDDILFNENITSTGKLLCALILDHKKTTSKEYCDVTPMNFSMMLGMDYLAIANAMRKLEKDGYIEKRETLSIKNTKKFEYKVKGL
jgi:Mn-dependent DtxR family transcriptional regulator